MIALVLALVALLAGPFDLAAQAGPRSVSSWPLATDEPWIALPPKAAPIDLPRVSPGVATAASLALPGTGQLLLGQKRWAIYAGLEIGAWIFHLERRREGHRLRNDYLDLSWRVARGTSPLPRDDGDWEYFERMGSWLRSGAFDANAVRDGVQPEADPESFNGATWALAQDIYLSSGAVEGDPSWVKALAFYEKRAYPVALAWDWRGKETSQAEYRNLIEWSDDALRSATVVLGAVVANHLFSAVDAYISSHGGPAVSAGAALRALPGGTAVEWTLEVRP